MSANIYWEPANKKRKSLEIMCPAKFQEHFPLPRTFTREDLVFLSGMGAAGYQEANKIIELIEKYDAITVWAEY